MRELVIDNFAGAGGASCGIEQALGIPVDIAINHDKAAIEMHKANHPKTYHYEKDIWKVDPVQATKGRPVGLVWFSPDCTHFSRAKGGKPVKKEIRGLAWSVNKWAREVRPRVMILENVAEFQEWGPLTAANKIDKKKKGKIFILWANVLRGLGYKVEWRELVASEYGAPTIRKRLFLIARCDGQPIVWPEKTHGPGLLPYRAAAECIDWSIPAPSIFERKRPLVDNTLRRIAKGIQRYVIEAEEPFIVRTGHYSNITGAGAAFRGQSTKKPLGTICSVNDKAVVIPQVLAIDHAGSNGKLVYDPKDPLRTITKENRFALVAPYLSKYHGEKSETEVRECRCEEPIKTVDTSNRFALISAFLSKYYTGVVGSKLKKPAPTVTAIDHNALVAANLIKFNGQSVGSDLKKPTRAVLGQNKDAIVATHLTKFYGTNIGSDMREPVPTVTASGQHIGEVRAFLIKYYGTNVGQSLKGPAHTITSKHRLGLVTVNGQEYQISDIGLRMLQPRELARAQGFSDDYILTGTKTSWVAKIGNSVCPVMAKVLVAANVKLQQVSKQKIG